MDRAAVRGADSRGGEGEVDQSFQLCASTCMRKAEGLRLRDHADRRALPRPRPRSLDHGRPRIAAQTTSIEIMPAVHPGIVTPQVVAKMGATPRPHQRRTLCHQSSSTAG